MHTHTSIYTHIPVLLHNAITLTNSVHIPSSPRRDPKWALFEPPSFVLLILLGFLRGASWLYALRGIGKVLIRMAKIF